MPRSDRASKKNKLDTSHVGWRLLQLRLRRGLRQNELAELAGLDAAYLNRLEKGAPYPAQPKPDTVNKILDALSATTHERNAVFHIEVPAPTPDQIQSIINEISVLYDDDPRPVTLLDYHWVRWYHNRTMRSILALSDEEYARTMGEQPLYSLIDPSSPTYYRIPDDERMEAFATRSQMFKLQFADQEFDSWYLEIVDNIRKFPEAAAVWDNPPQSAQKFLDSHEASLYSPALRRKLAFTSQLNRLMADPRFVVVLLTPRDEETARLMGQLRSAAGHN